MKWLLLFPLAVVIGFFFLPSDRIASHYKLMCDVSEEEAMRRWQALKPPDYSKPGPFGERFVELDLDAIDGPGGEQNALPPVGSQERYEKKLEIWRNMSLEEHEYRQFRKSGLRMAIESRLAWLGLRHEISLFEGPCSND